MAATLELAHTGIAIISVISFRNRNDAGNAGSRRRGNEAAQRYLQLLRRVMKYLLLGLFLASVVGLEVFHELSNSDAPGAAYCMAPESRQEATKDMLMLHLHSH